MLRRSAQTVLGVDIGDNRISVVELRKKGPRYILQRAVQTTVPSEVVAEGRIVRPETMAERLRELLREARMRAKAAHLVVPSQFVVIRQLDLPDLPEKQLRKVIDFELQHSIHLPFDDVQYDIVKQGRKPDLTELEEGEACEVTLIASTRSTLDPLVATATGAGLKPRSVDIRALALYRAFHLLNQEHDEQETLMVVEVSESSTDIHIFDGPALKFTRNVPMALTQYALDKELDKPLGIAELLHLFQTNTDWRAFANDLGYEIERSLNFYRYTLNNREANLSRLLLAGLLPRTDALAAHLQERLPDSMPTVMPYADLEVADGSADLALHEFAVALGLALKEVK